MKLVFDPSSLLRMSNIVESDGRTHGKDNDPKMIYRWPGRFRSGWHEFELLFEEDVGGVPQLFFDLGHGFNEVEHIDMVRRRGHRALYRGLIRLPSRPGHVRLDPSNNNNAFSIRGFQVRRLGLPVVAMRGGLRVLRTSLVEPSRVRPMLARGVELLTGNAIAGVNIREVPNVRVRDPYTSWQETYDFRMERDEKGILRELVSKTDLPKISVLMPVYNPNPVHLREAIGSVCGQIYDNWELCIADDASTDPRIEKILRAAMKSDSRIKVRFRRENGHIAEASNSALALVTGEWVVMLDHDDLLRPHTLAEIALVVARHPETQIIYSDEDKIDDDGHRFDPHFKPDFSPDLFRSMNYLNHVTAHRKDNILAVGAWQKGFEGAQDYDLNLRIIDLVQGRGVRHIPRILYHWRATAGSTALAQGEKHYAWQAGKRALEDHLRRNQINAEIEEIADVPYYRTRFAIRTPQPSVSLIIPTRDKVDILEQAVTSIFDKTRYRDFDVIIVDNGSVDPETHDYFQRLMMSGLPVRVLEWDKPFNYSAINNFAVRHTQSEILGLINNDIEVVSPDWLTEMVSWAQQTRIGCVGAKLYYPDMSIQHAGVIAGIGGVAGHSHKYFDQASHGYFSRLKVAQNVSAVTAACLLVRREIYESMGGLDEDGLTVAFNDVDFCFRVSQAGYLNLWTPWAELIHHESKSRGTEDTPEKIERFQKEIRHMQGRWADMIERDPFYNPNLTREHEDFSIRN